MKLGQNNKIAYFEMCNQPRKLIPSKYAKKKISILISQKFIEKSLINSSYTHFN